MQVIVCFCLSNRYKKLSAFFISVFMVSSVLAASIKPTQSNPISMEIETFNDQVSCLYLNWNEKKLEVSSIEWLQGEWLNYYFTEACGLLRSSNFVAAIQSEALENSFLISVHWEEDRGIFGVILNKFGNEEWYHSDYEASQGLTRSLGNDSENLHVINISAF